MGAQRQRYQRLRCQSFWKRSLQGCTRSAEGSRHRLDAPILGARQDPTELDLGNVLWLAENKHLLYNFQLNIIQLLSIREEITETAAWGQWMLLVHVFSMLKVVCVTHAENTTSDQKCKDTGTLIANNASPLLKSHFQPYTEKFKIFYPLSTSKPGI